MGRADLRPLFGRLCLTGLALLAAGCAPEVGSERWCRAMDEMPKGEWTANDAAAYAKHCVLRLKTDE